MYSTRGLTIPYSTLFLSVNNMRGHGLRIYYGGQRGNSIGGLFKPVLTRVAIPQAKRVAVVGTQFYLYSNKFYISYFSQFDH